MKSFWKTAVISIILVLSFFALMEIKGETMSGKRLHKMVFLETQDDWRRCQLANCRLLEKANSITFANLSVPAELTTGIIDPGFPFTQLILSWNSTRPDSSSALDFNVEVSSDSAKWHRFAYQTYGADYENYGTPNELDGIGRMKVDYLALARPMRFARVIVKASGSPQSQEIILRRLALSFSNDNATWDDYKAIHGAPKPLDYLTVKLAVPYLTQRNLPKDLSGNCCSPTSVSMVMNYHGIAITPEEMAHKAYDPRGDIYGNWPQNVAAAFSAGLGRTWVEVHCSFDEIYNEVASGKPVVISIAYDYDQLPHSPIHGAPEGHLITVVGFDGPNTVICNDPAGHSAEDGIVNYPRKELEDIWIKHGGVAYHLWPKQ